MSSLFCTEPVAHVSPDPQEPPGQSAFAVQGAPLLLPPRHSVWIRSPFVSPPILVKTVGSPAGHSTHVSPDGQGCVESQNCSNVTLQRLTRSVDSASTPKAMPPGGMLVSFIAGVVSPGAIGGSVELTNVPPSKMPPLPPQVIGVV